ncbi:gamma-glutamyltransferase family protein [Nesterenkonia muleiensis]|uniref:gamma-glutamyltransferase family protein n=1 Tax=Nesterenkonia muleiensis TaxID=2282648 RepID=UPI0013008EAD|nr:gamma-glutamyltransferase [Nesterenkonia muleiensis]
MIVLHRNPARVIVPLAAVCLTAGSCGIAEQEPPPPQETAQDPGQQQSDDAPTATPEATEDPGPLVGEQGISAGHEEAVDAAEAAFDQGGNAVDAAVAGSFAIAVVEPVASGIGGGGSAILAGPEGHPVFYDYREVVNSSGEIPDSGTGVPGFVAGMGQLHQDYGDLEWEQVTAPAVELAGEGFEVSDYLAERIGGGAGAELLADAEAFTQQGQPLAAGDTLVQPELEETLQRLSEAGWEDYYTGQLAESLTEQVEGVDAESLAGYEVISSEPVTGDLGDYQIVSASPSLPGAALIQMLQIAEAEGVADMDPESAEYIDALSRAWKVAEETIDTDLGDPNFVDVPVEEITDPEANAQLEATGADQEPQASAEDPEDSAHANTTHISVVDETGLTVSMTNTVTDFWGSGQAVDGYFMNNALDRFADIDSAANQPSPGRRSVTWSNPSMVLDDQGRPVMAIGTPGGKQILPALATVISQWVLQGADLQEAVDAARFRSEDSLLYLEAGQPPELHTGLAELGWQIEEWPDSSFGSVQALVIDYDSETITGADDPRRDGAHRVID